MPKLLIAVSTKKGNKTLRRAATSMQNLKVLCTKRAEKYEDPEYCVMTFSDRLTLKHIVNLINKPTKKLRELADSVERFTVYPEKTRGKYVVEPW